MGAYVTSSRSLGKSPGTVKRFVNGGSAVEMAVIDDLHTQRTTSFRSSQALDIVGQEAEALDDRVYASTSIGLGWTGDTGHTFDSLKSRRVLYQRDVDLSRTYQADTTRVRGPMVLVTDRMASEADASKWLLAEFPLVPSLTSNETKLWGGRAINATVPTKPQANLSGLLGELYRDGIPSFIGASSYSDKVSIPRNAGNEYLNLEFGWKPLVQDVEKIIKSLRGSTRTLLQMERDSGRMVRRRFSFPPEITSDTSRWETSSSTVACVGWNNMFSNGFQGGDAGYRTDRISTRYWFSGAYSYHLELGDSVKNKLLEFEQKANHLLGTRVNASTLWELAPWSWLIDWKVAVGTAMSNAAAFSDDGLVMKYGYLMRHTVADRTVSATPRIWFSGAQPLTVTNAYRTERKERVRATPYGFGLDPDAFSVKQWAILASLGITQKARIAK